MTLCLFNQLCEFRDKEGNCTWEGSCNQKAIVHIVEGKEILLRRMNGDLVTVMSLPRHLRENLLRKYGRKPKRSTIE